MKDKLIVLALVLLTASVHAQTVALPPFIKWETNNSPVCKNVFVGRDSMLMAVKNPCVSEGIRANWRPSAGVSDGLHFSVAAGAKVQLVVTYKFMPQGGDVLAFYGTFDPESDNSDLTFSRNLELEGGVKALSAADRYTTVTIPVNFSAESANPVWAAPSALKGNMNFNFSVTTNGGETHQGSYAVIKSVKLEVK